MPTIEQLKARFPRASESFIRRNADGIPIDSAGGVRDPERTSAANPVAALNAPPVRPMTTDEQRLNKTERRWLDVLRSRNFVGLGIQSLTLKLGHDCRYTPDFITCDVAGLVTLWEVKGPWIYEKAMYKPRTAARQFPWFRFVLAQWKTGQWTETLIKP
jgi:hypothetical protein